MDKQTDRDFEDLRRQQAERAFLLDAAAEIARQEDEEFLAAQSLPDPPEELMARLDANVYKVLRRGGRKKNAFAALAYLGRAVAVLALISGAALTLGYVSVDATREKVNAFLLENFGTHVVVQTGETEEESGQAFPTDWDGKVRPAWVPKRFTSVESTSAGRSGFLYYTSSNSSDLLIINIWTSSASPFGDAEQMGDEETLTVQDVSASLYYKEDTHFYTLLFTKSDITIQIFGSVSREEIIKIAENISF